MSVILVLSFVALIGILGSAYFYRKSLVVGFQKLELQKELERFEKQIVNQEAFQKQMKESFQSLAHEALIQQTELGKHDLEKRQITIDNMITPLQKTLEMLQTQTASMEKDRQRAFVTVENELKRVVETSANLSQETRSLKNALKKPHVRGRWGEVQLKNCVELAGMSEFADVQFQDVNTTDEGQKLIPDLTVKMPGGRQVIVDAKTPIDAFIASLESTTDEQKNIEMKRHGNQVREHIKKLSLKAYGEQLKNSADFTVMFLPNESFLYAALETQPDLVEFAIDRKILIATPPTFVGLLKVIRYGWNEEKLAANAEKIRDVGRELHKRAVEFSESYITIGKYLGLASDKYDEGLKRLNQRFVPQAKKMEELGAKSNKDLPESLSFDPPLELND